jgi:hypothetical protein
VRLCRPASADSDPAPPQVPQPDAVLAAPAEQLSPEAAEPGAAQPPPRVGAPEPGGSTPGSSRLDGGTPLRYYD